MSIKYKTTLIVMKIDVKIIIIREHSNIQLKMNSVRLNLRTKSVRSGPISNLVQHSCF